MAPPSSDLRRRPSCPRGGADRRALDASSRWRTRDRRRRRRRARGRTTRAHWRMRSRSCRRVMCKSSGMRFTTASRPRAAPSPSPRRPSPPRTPCTCK